MSYLTFKRARGRPKKISEKSPPLPKRYHPLDFLRVKKLITPEMQEAGLIFEQDFYLYQKICAHPGLSRISSFIKREPGQGICQALADRPWELRRIGDYKRAYDLLEEEGKGLSEAVLRLFEISPFSEVEGARFLKTLSLSKIRKGLRLLWHNYKQASPHTLLECHSTSLLKEREV